MTLAPLHHQRQRTACIETWNAWKINKLKIRMLGSQKKCSTWLLTLGVRFLPLWTLTVLAGFFYGWHFSHFNTPGDLIKRFPCQVFLAKIFVFSCLWSDTSILAQKNVILGNNWTMGWLYIAGTNTFRYNCICENIFLFKAGKSKGSINNL